MVKIGLKSQRISARALRLTQVSLHICVDQGGILIKAGSSLLWQVRRFSKTAQGAAAMKAAKEKPADEDLKAGELLLGSGRFSGVKLF